MIENQRKDDWDKYLDSLDQKENSIYKVNKYLFHKQPAKHLLKGQKLYERDTLFILQTNIGHKIRKEQHTFRLGRSTTLQLTKLIDKIIINTNYKEQIAANFLDV